MNAIILSIGDELLIGQVVNTNASWLGEQLTASGYRVVQALAIGDDRQVIADEINKHAEVPSVIIVSGGLGPTHDDVTREAICDLLECGMTLDDAQLERIEERFGRMGVELNERSRKQAMYPTACRPLPNRYGSAPGLAFTKGKASVYVLPGVPKELRGIFDDSIRPELQQGAQIRVASFLLFGIAESKLADELAETRNLIDDDVTLAFLPSYSGVRLRAMLLQEHGNAPGRYEQLLAVIRERGAQWMVGEGGAPLPVVVGEILQQQGRRLATAESCTGGMIGELITAVAGSSAYYMGGVISYANSAKVGLLGVDPVTLEAEGAVSEQVARQMAEGARTRLGADIALSVTGIAGPDGGSVDKPVGTVWIGIATAERTYARKYLLGNERDVIRTRAAYTALDMVRRYLIQEDVT